MKVLRLRMSKRAKAAKANDNHDPRNGRFTTKPGGEIAKPVEPLYSKLEQVVAGALPDKLTPLVLPPVKGREFPAKTIRDKDGNVIKEIPARKEEDKPGYTISVREQLARILKEHKVSDDEIKWSGVLHFAENLSITKELAFDGDTSGSVSKADILSHLKEDGMINFQEVLLGGKPSIVKGNEEEMNRHYTSEANAQDNLEIARARLRAHSFPASTIDLLNMDQDDEDGGDYTHSILSKEKYAPIKDDIESYVVAYNDLRRIRANAPRHTPTESITKPTQYEKWKLDGGDNYREMVLTLEENPSIKYTKDNVIPRSFGDDELSESHHARFWVFKTPDNCYQIPKSKYPTMEEARDYVIANKKPLTGVTYENPHHFTDIPDYVAHMRLTDRADAEGKLGTFIEEIQSDRHQDARDKGYVDADQNQKEIANMEVTIARYEAEQLDLVARMDSMDHLFMWDKDGASYFLNPITSKLKVLPKGSDEWEFYEGYLDMPDSILDKRGITKEVLAGMVSYQELKAKRDFLSRQAGSLRSAAERKKVSPSGIPDAPFRKSKEWGKQMFKRALRDAIAEGHEWVGWTKGIVHVERYENALRKAVDTIKWDSTYSQDTINVTAFKNGGGVFNALVDPNGIIKESVMSDTVGKHISEVIGKDAASKIMGSPNGELKDKELTVGGEGMKGFYDEILVNSINEYVKEWGATVELSDLNRKKDFVPHDFGAESEALQDRYEAGETLTPEEMHTLFAPQDFNGEKAVPEMPFWKVAITKEMRESITKHGQDTFKSPYFVPMTKGNSNHDPVTGRFATGSGISNSHIEENLELLGLPVTGTDEDTGTASKMKDAIARRLQSKLYSALKHDSRDQRLEYAQNVLDGWAGSSTEDTWSQMLQLHAKAIHGAVLSEGQIDRMEMGETMSEIINTSGDQVGPDYAKDMAITAGVALEAMYNDTQALLKSKGKKPTDTITLYRGMNYIGKHNKKSNEIEFQDNALSSWSVLPAIARTFCARSGKMVVSAEIPISDILCTPATGIGCFNEAEVVVISKGPIKAKITYLAPKRTEADAYKEASEGKAAKPNDFTVDVDSSADWIKEVTALRLLLQVNAKSEKKFDPSEKRDANGRWSKDGSNSAEYDEESEDEEDESEWGWFDPYDPDEDSNEMHTNAFLPAPRQPTLEESLSLEAYQFGLTYAKTLRGLDAETYTKDDWGYRKGHTPESLIKNLDGFMLRTGYKTEGTVTVRRAMGARFLKDLKKGDTFTDDAYLSTTKDMKSSVLDQWKQRYSREEECAFVDIVNPEGTPCIDLGSMSDLSSSEIYDYQKELLLPRGCKMKVVYRTATRLTMELVGYAPLKKPAKRRPAKKSVSKNDGLDRYIWDEIPSGVEGTKKYNPDEARDHTGRWTSGNSAGYIKALDDLAKSHLGDDAKLWDVSQGLLKIPSKSVESIAADQQSYTGKPLSEEAEKSYGVLIDFLSDQYKTLIASGLKVYPWNGEGEPYGNPPGSFKPDSNLMRSEIDRTGKYSFFKTTSGFGTGDGTTNHPMMRPTDLKTSDGQDMLANDVFRVVHDFVAHVKGGFSFSTRGEMNGMVAHASMLPEGAWPALYAETFAQNCVYDLTHNYAEQNAFHSPKAIPTIHKLMSSTGMLTKSADVHTDYPLGFQHVKRVPDTSGTKKYDPNEARDSGGRWTKIGSGAREAMESLSSIPSLQEAYEHDAGVSEGYTLGEHTGMVADVLESQRQYYDLEGISQRNGIDANKVMSYAVALHDIGKGIALDKGDKDKQHEETYHVIESLREYALPYRGLTPREITAIEMLVTHDLMGRAFQGMIKPQAAADTMSSNAKYAEMLPNDFVDLAKLMYVSDAASYPYLHGLIFRHAPMDSKLELNSAPIDKLTAAVDAKYRAETGKGDASEALHHIINANSVGSRTQAANQIANDIIEGLIDSSSDEQAPSVKSLVNMADLWAASSTNNTQAACLQEQACSMFNIHTNPTFSHMEEIIGKEPHADRLAEMREVARAALPVVYKLTQKLLERCPGDYVTLYRGVTLRNKEGDEPVEDGEEVSYQDNPLSSWSLSYSVALDFMNRSSSYGDNVKALVSAKVPKSEVVATPETGLGCWSEKEVVVVSSKPRIVNVVTHRAGKPSPYVTPNADGTAPAGDGGIQI